jgi:ribonuclease R
MLSDSFILRHIGRQPKKTASYKQLLRELSVKADGRRELADRLQALVKKGELLEVDSDRYAIPQTASNRNMFVGRLSMHRDGFGFVIPQANSQSDVKAGLPAMSSIPL